MYTLEYVKVLNWDSHLVVIVEWWPQNPWQLLKLMTFLHFCRWVSTDKSRLHLQYHPPEKIKSLLDILSIRVLSGAQIRILWVSALKKAITPVCWNWKVWWTMCLFLIIVNVSYATYFLSNGMPLLWKVTKYCLEDKKQVVMFRALLLAIKGSQPSLSVLEVLCQKTRPRVSKSIK